MVACLWRGMSRNRPFFALLAPVEGGRGSAAAPVGLQGWSLSSGRSVTPSAPCIRRCMGSRTPYGATTGEPLAGQCLWSSCVLLRCQDLLRCRAIPIPTGFALVVGHALAPLPCATLGAGMQRGMVHGEQMWCWCRRLIRCHRESGAPLGTSGVAVSLSGTRCCLVCWSPSTAGVRPHDMRHVGLHRTVWPQTGDWLVPIPQHRGQQFRRLAFG